jgi:hypothetical protein
MNRKSFSHLQQILLFLKAEKIPSKASQEGVSPQPQGPAL